jgi:GDP-4-dehydro-6-deoxy-D-mannose reductase
MRILVTGAAGFVGRYALAELAGAGHVVSALDLSFSGRPAGATQILEADLCAPDALREAVAATRPEACLHLGALAYVPAGDTAPERMFAVNVLGTMHLADALAAHAPGCRLLAVSTAQVLGRRGGDTELEDNAPARPDSVYAVSKAAMETAVWGRAADRRIAALLARPNNHTGPGQSDRFVVPSLAAQVLACRTAGSNAVLHVGNLDSIRDFLDVRDVARAYRLLLEAGQAGSTYNIASGTRVSIRTILDTLCRLAGVSPAIKVDPARFRPSDASPLLDTARLRADTGWAPKIPLEDTLRDMLEAR